MRTSGPLARRFVSARACAIIACVLVVATPLAAPADDPISALLARGAYADAERMARQGLAQVERDPAATPVETELALERLVRSLIENGHGGATDAVPLSNRMLMVAETAFDAADPHRASALDAAGMLRTARGEYADAVEIAQRAVRFYADHPDGAAQASALEHLADSQLALERFDDALLTLTTAARIRESHRTEDSLGVASVEERLATLFRLKGDMPDAQAHLQRAFDIRRDLTPNHPDVAALTHLRGDTEFLSGDMVSARADYAAAVDLASRTLGDRHPLTGLYLRKLALIEWVFGDATRARTLREQARRIAEASLAPCHPELPLAFNDLAASDLDGGDYGEARTLFDRARLQLERCLGPTHSLVATAVYNLAAVAKATGDWAEAERLLNRAIRVWTTTLGAEHPFVTRAQDSLAEVASARGLRRRALAMHQQVLATRRKVLGPNHPDVARTLTDLAQNAEQLGNHALALRYADDAEAIYSRAGAADEAAPLAILLELRADIERAQGNRQLALQHLQAAREIRAKRFGDRHPSIAVVAASAATIDLETGEYRRALQGALAAEERGRSILQFTIRELPERQALAFSDVRAKGLSTALSVAAADTGADASQILDAVVRSRAIVLDELAARAHAIDSTDPTTAALQHESAAARQRYANLMLRAIQSTGGGETERLEEARIAKERAERALAERSAEAREELARSTAGLEQIRAALPTGSALVSFVKYDRTRRPARPDAPPLPVVASYAAFVMANGSSEPVFVPLGSAATIEPLIRSWRAAVLAGATVDGTEEKYRAAATPLRARIWDPIVRRLSGASRVFIVPDGLLNLVNFASLPTTNGRYLVETATTLHYLSTERDLLVDAPRSDAMTALIVGRPAFEGAATARRLKPAPTSTSQAPALQSPAAVHASATARAASIATRDGCVGAGGWQFGDLPGTGREVADISRVWMRAGRAATVLTGTAATKSAFRQALGTRRVVHLATHGFFVGEGCAPTTTARRTRSVGGLVVTPSPTSSTATANDNPLLLSGLALAGANRRTTKTDQDNGILTAEEIAGLDLRGTEWAVLSACDTGLGEIRAGEGVFGLRRAFQIAGARTVIMSLWSVDDEATRVWMRSLYEGRLLRQLDTADAVKQASLAVLAQRRAAHQSTHPFYWAAFVAAGDWR